jgi:ferric-chelate reductase [NAD(P)H]
MDTKVLYKISYGLYIVSSKKDSILNGQIANAVFQATAEPPQIAIAINTENLTHEFLESSRVFSVSILEQDTPMKLIGHFGFRTGKNFNKFESIEYKTGITGAPVVLQNTLGYLECKIVKEFNVGTHTIFIGEIVDAQKIKDGIPMTYAYYHQIKKGISPKNAPTYNKYETEERKEKK